MGFEPTCVLLTFHQFRRPRVYASMICYCGTETTNSKYCSRSCATRVNNVKTPKRKAKPRTCHRCLTLIPKHDRTCSSCRRTKGIAVVELGKLTLADVSKKCASNGIAPSYKHSYVRNHCRAVNAHLQKRCQVCSYDRHVEYCHVKAISTFPERSLISDINHETNIMVLCRNHHWELDHGFLSPENVPSR